MFTGFFYALKKRKVPVSITEWMTLMEALARGYITTLEDFYYLGRAILVKSEAYFDHYDVAFREYFEGIEGPAEITEEVLKWLNDPMTRKMLEQQGAFRFTDLTLDELLQGTAKAAAGTERGARRRQLLDRAQRHGRRSGTAASTRTASGSAGRAATAPPSRLRKTASTATTAMTSPSM